MTNKQANTLTAVSRAATRRARAEDAYKQAIIQAHEAGHRLTEIGAAAGLSKQGVYYLTRPDPRKEQKT